MKIHYNKKKILSITAVIFSEILLLTGVVFLGIKIKGLNEGQVKGIQYVTQLDKNNLVISTDSGKLQYYYDPKPNVNQKSIPDWLGYEAIYTINKDGLNERRDYAVEKPGNTFRIITLGDSWTYGHYVNTAENYSEILEDKLNTEMKCSEKRNFEVINLGVYGYDNEYMRQRLISKGLKYKADLVIIFLHDWDFEKLNEIYMPLKDKLVKEGIPEFNYDNQGKLIRPAANKAFTDHQKQYGKEKIIEYQTKTLFDIPNHYPGNILFLSSESLPSDLKQRLKLFTDLNPSKYSYYSSITDIEKDLRYQLPDQHPNVEGHKKIANDIFQYLKKNILMQCN